ncbi:hypothetical protein KVR01_008919 [Diaporthe batatas]|uniref:uncharacterized protein n=1 Tax=Diaporthe batatas TaxID=748121 RepID=UPI001D03992B|nr:uncharacterized protein KVR01_008919 [Diaporthe batatas]KAG8160655.1 hypothetical protein KVR01_008919 [Diaporthe batatas]
MAGKHIQLADKKMAYMEAYPGGLDNDRSYENHVTAIVEALDAAVGNLSLAEQRADGESSSLHFILL